VASPLQDSVGNITPSSLHYIAATRQSFIPDIDPKQHTLTIHGLPALVNRVIPEDEVLDKQGLPKVKMPIGDEYGRLLDWKPNTPRLEGYPF
jgi:hypothetical protein